MGKVQLVQVGEVESRRLEQHRLVAGLSSSSRLLAYLQLFPTLGRMVGHGTKLILCTRFVIEKEKR